MGLLAPWFALLLPFLTLCRTAVFDSASLERRSTVSGSLATFVVSQTNNSLVGDLAQNRTVDTDLEEIEYEIPHTSRYVSIVINKNEPLDPTSFHKVIVTALSRLNRHIASHGDGPLQPLDDPYQVIFDDCNSTTHSDLKDDGTPWLTYKILLETFIGLKAILDDKRRYFVTGYSTADLEGVAYGQGTIAAAIRAAAPAAMSMNTEK